jgi:hypothetical protein
MTQQFRGFIHMSERRKIQSSLGHALPLVLKSNKQSAAKIANTMFSDISMRQNKSKTLIPKPQIDTILNERFKRDHLPEFFENFQKLYQDTIVPTKLSKVSYNRAKSLSNIARGNTPKFTHHQISTERSVYDLQNRDLESQAKAPTGTSKDAITGQ